MHALKPTETASRWQCHPGRKRCVASDLSQVRLPYMRIGARALRRACWIVIQHEQGGEQPQPASAEADARYAKPAQAGYNPEQRASARFGYQPRIHSPAWLGCWIVIQQERRSRTPKFRKLRSSDRGPARAEIMRGGRGVLDCDPVRAGGLRSGMSSE